MAKKIEDLTRREVRYLCFRLQTEAEGGNQATQENEGLMSFVNLIKEHLGDQDDFGGWPKFAKTWDVDQKSPLVTVKRSNSIHSEWNKVLKSLAKDLPGSEPEPKKFLTNELAEKVQKKKATLAQRKRRDDDEV